MDEYMEAILIEANLEKCRIEFERLEEFKEKEDACLEAISSGLPSDLVLEKIADMISIVNRYFYIRGLQDSIKLS